MPIIYGTKNPIVFIFVGRDLKQLTHLTLNICSNLQGINFRKPPPQEFRRSMNKVCINLCDSMKKFAPRLEQCSVTDSFDDSSLRLTCGEVSNPAGRKLPPPPENFNPKLKNSPPKKIFSKETFALSNPKLSWVVCSVKIYERNVQHITNKFLYIMSVFLQCFKFFVQAKKLYSHSCFCFFYSI